MRENFFKIQLQILSCKKRRAMLKLYHLPNQRTQSSHFKWGSYKSSSWTLTQMLISLLEEWLRLQEGRQEPGSCLWNQCWVQKIKAKRTTNIKQPHGTCGEHFYLFGLFFLEGAKLKILQHWLTQIKPTANFTCWLTAMSQPTHHVCWNDSNKYFSSIQ